MATPIRIKRTAVPGRRPELGTDLISGELALNTSDGYLFTETNVAGLGATVTNLTPFKEAYGQAFVTYDGSVGIGLTVPQAKLDVAGNVNIEGNLNVIGTITKEDITDLDSIGVVTARSGIDVISGGTLIQAGGLTVQNGTSTFGGFVDINNDLDVSGFTTFREDVFFGNEDRAIFGGDQGLQIYNSGSSSIIADVGFGDLNLRGTARIVLANSAGIETYARFNVDGASELYYDNTKRFETISTGATVFGDAYVGGSLYVNDAIIRDGDLSGRNLNISGIATVAGDINANGNIVGDNSTNISGINSVTATSFFGDGAGLENTGASLSAASGYQRLVLTSLTSGTMVSAATDADLSVNDGSVGLGTTNPRSGLEVHGTTGARITRALTGGNVSGYKFHINNPSGNSFSLNVGRVFNDVVATSLFDITQNGDIVPSVSGSIDLGSSSITWDNIYGGTLYTDDKIGHRGDTNTFIRFPSADTFSVETSGSEKFRITSGGDVGIGSTIPTAKLDVDGTVNVSGVSTFNDSVDIEGVNSVLDVKEGKIYTTEVQGNNRELYIRGGGSQTTRPTIHLPNGDDPLSILGDSTDIFGIVIDSRSSGVVDIKHNSSTKLQTTGYGVSVYGTAELENVNVSGVSTFTGAIDANGDLDVDGHTNLDNVSISGVATISNTIVGGATTELVVQGDARVTGIITVGTSSITLDGPNDKIIVGSGLTIDGGSNAIHLGSNVTIDSSGLDITGVSSITATTIYGAFDGELNACGHTYYVSTTGNNSHTGDNINQPFLTIAKALSVATNGDMIQVAAGTYEEVCPLTIPRGVTVEGSGLRATTVKPTDATKTNNVFLFHDVSTLTDLTIKESYYNSTADTGYAFAYATGIAITTRSPYVERVTVLGRGTNVSVSDPYGYDTADSPPTSYLSGRGALVDGSLVASNSLEAGFLFNEVTFFTPNNKGIVMTNGARVEHLNTFHYFSSQALVGTSGTTGIGGTANARVKIIDPTVALPEDAVIKQFSGGTAVAIGTIVSYDAPYATISSKGSGIFTSVGAGSTQDLRIFQADGTTQTGIATRIAFADYKMFGAEVRSVAGAIEYGAQGVVADGDGVNLRLFAINFNYVGSGKDFTNDDTLVIQANETTEIGNGEVSYVSIDQRGDFRVGESFFVDQESGNVSFAATTFDLDVTGNLQVTDGGSNTSTLSPTSLEVGSMVLSANQLASSSGDITIDPAGSNQTYIQGDLGVVGILTAQVINVDALQKGDTSVALDDTGSDGTIRFNTDGTEAFRVNNAQNMGIGNNNPSVRLDVAGDVNVDGSVSVGAGLTVVGITTFDGGDVQFHGATAGRDLTLDRSGNKVILDDNFKVSFGAAGHAQMYHNGGSMWFQNYTGNIEFQTPVGSTYDFYGGLINAQAGLTVTGNAQVSGVSTLGNTVVGGATTELVVSGDARVTGILSVGQGTLTLDGPNNIVNVGTALTLGHTQGVQFHTQFLHSEGFEVNNINATGITTSAGVINSNTDIQINGTSVLTSASDEAVALAIALG